MHDIYTLIDISRDKSKNKNTNLVYITLKCKTFHKIIKRVKSKIALLKKLIFLSCYSFDKVELN